MRRADRLFQIVQLLRSGRLLTAAFERQRLTFKYSNKSGAATERTVRPLGVWFWGLVWTMVAWCETRDDFRVFRVDRLENVERGDPFRDEKGKLLSDFLAAQVGTGGFPPR